MLEKWKMHVHPSNQSIVGNNPYRRYTVLYWQYLQVYQAISAYSSRLDNIVEFYSTTDLPQLPGLPPVDPIVLTASLKYYFEPVGGSTVSITFEDTEVKGTGEPVFPPDLLICNAEHCTCDTR